MFINQLTLFSSEMNFISRINKTEYLVYGVIILLFLVSPTFSTLFHGHDIDDAHFLIDDFMLTLKAMGVFIIAFVIHDIVIAPLLVEKHQPWLYMLGVVVLGSVFMLYQCHRRPAENLGPNHPKTEKRVAPPRDTKNDLPTAEPLPPPKIDDKDHAPKPIAPPPLRRHDILTIIMFLFGIGTNIGVKFYFRSLEARKKLEHMEKEHFKHSLYQLRHQLHPHFFMNTLNNIHALIDIDPKKAQQCIIDLSRLMRSLLYYSNHEYVQASSEIEFMKNYVQLTRIRYNDKLKFTVTSPNDGTNVWIPPLLFISFVENAFKHGVSYNNESFIDINGKVYDGDNGQKRLYWTCHNSKHKNNGSSNNKNKIDEASGIGLTNVRQRLDLIFGNNYSLIITDGENDYLVEMDIPIFTSDPSK